MVVIFTFSVVFCFTENAVDVPAEMPKVKAPDDEVEVVHEDMTQAQVNVVETVPRDMSKQNGGIPIIVTTDADTPVSDTSLPYEPEETVLDDSESVAKSLEEQVLELEQEVEMMHQNHVEERIKPEQTVANESKPKDQVVTTQNSRCSCKKVFAYTFFSLFLTLTVSVCVVMFSDVKHPIADEMRNHLTFLEPTRDFLFDKYQELLNKL